MTRRPHRIAAENRDEPFPDRAAHRAAFEELLGQSYAAEVAQGFPIAFVYLGQTTPEPTQGLISSINVAQPSEVPAAFVNMMKTAKAAGHLPDEVLAAVIRDLQEVLEASSGECAHDWVPSDAGETCARCGGARGVGGA